MKTFKVSWDKVPGGVKVIEDGHEFAGVFQNLHAFFKWRKSLKSKWW